MFSMEIFNEISNQPPSIPEVFPLVEPTPEPIGNCFGGVCSEDAWYTIQPSTVFNGNIRAADDGACNGHWKDEKFMHAPYIEMDSSKITAQIVGEAVGTSACIN